MKAFNIKNLIFLSILLWVPLSQADTIDSGAYNLGIALGFASFQASIGSEQSIEFALRELRRIQGTADNLYQTGILLEEFYNYGRQRNEKRPLRFDLEGYPGRVHDSTLQQMYGSTIHRDIVDLRHKLWNSLRLCSKTYANYFSIGLHLAMIEGQTTSPHWNAAKRHALKNIEALKELRRLSIYPVPIDRDLDRLEYDLLYESPQKVNSRTLNIRTNLEQNLLRKDSRSRQGLNACTN